MDHLQFYCKREWERECEQNFMDNNNNSKTISDCLVVIVSNVVETGNAPSLQIRCVGTMILLRGIDLRGTPPTTGLECIRRCFQFVLGICEDHLENAAV